MGSWDPLWLGKEGQLGQMGHLTGIRLAVGVVGGGGMLVARHSNGLL